jgi:hypothetical protein
VPERGHDNCSETSSVFIIRPTAQGYGVLVKISGLIVAFSELGHMSEVESWRWRSTPAT